LESRSKSGDPQNVNVLDYVHDADAVNDHDHDHVYDHVYVTLSNTSSIRHAS
jgi:hypothetical protein